MNYEGDIKLHGYFGFLHEGPWLRTTLKVRKSSSMTLNEVLYRRQPDLLLYIYINMTVYMHYLISSNIVPLL
jgi:hypothetical protein